jgi:hypothetical protein
MEQLLSITNEPKVLELERTEDGHYHIIITLTKLNQVSKLDFFLSSEQAEQILVAMAS